MPLIGHSFLNPFPIAAMRLHGGFFHFNVNLAHGGVDLDDPVGGGFGDDLLAGLALLGYINEEVASDFAGAGQTAAHNVVLGQVGGLDRPHRGEMVGHRGDVVFGEVAFLHHNLAFAAGLAAPTNGFEFNPEQAGGIQQGGALRNLSPAARGHEGNG
jgi:hypothetical protein